MKQPTQLLSDSIALFFPYILIVKGINSFPIFILVAIMSLFNEVLKRITKIKRPDKSDLESFPSNHSASSLLMALLLNSPFLFIWSGAIAWSRYKLKRHRLIDIVCGAIIGILFYFIFSITSF